MSNKEKTVATKEIGGKKKKKISIGWIFGAIILILISITFVLPTGLFMQSDNSIKFGKYNGTDIEFAPNNYFYTQYVNNANSTTYDPNTIQGLFDIWHQSFLTTVFHTAISDLADAAKITVPSSVVDKYVISSGAYAIDETSTFDAETYKSTDDATKALIRDQIKASIVDSKIVNDFASVKSSNAELAFVSDMAANGRPFEYALFSADLYPDSLAAEYMAANPAQFEMADLQIISFLSAEEVEKGIAEINAGTLTFEEAAAQYSQDQLAQTNAELGPTYRWSLAMNFYDAANADEVFATEEGSIAGPFLGYTGYTVFKVNKAAYAPDLTDPETLSDSKYYIGQVAPEEVAAYTKAAAEEFYARASEIGFAEAANEMDVATKTISAVSQNVGGSSLYPSFSTFDQGGYLNEATTNNDAFVKELYTVADNTVLAPQEAAGAYIVTEAKAFEPNDTMRSYMDIYYSYMAASQNQLDNQNVIFSSESFENNFNTVFFNEVLGSTAE